MQYLLDGTSLKLHTHMEDKIKANVSFPTTQV